MLQHPPPQAIPSDLAKVHHRPHRRFGKWRKGILLVAFVTGLLPNTAIGEPFIPKQARSVPASPSYRHLVAQKPLGAEELNTIAVFEKAAQSVVYITNTAVRRDIWSLNTFEVPQGSGSGFIWNRQGHIVTNYHVIYGADSIQVVLDDQSTRDARIVGVDPDHDLAVLQISGKPETLMPLEIGTSQDLRVGQRVLAIGNPFGLDHTLTTGVVSALGRSIKSVNDRTIENAIQTDAAINPGNSGGPLLNSAGELIGVNTQIVSPSGAYAGIGFAVPVDIVKRVVPQLIQYGKVIRPGLGISLIPDSIAARWGIKGLVIAKVLPGSMADKAGLHGLEETKTGRIRLGDVITAIDGEAIRTYDDLARLLDRHNVGDRIKLGIRRSGKEQTLSLKLQAVQ
ncbi:S1C family serine protease [Candidatus Nitrospira neomarina]|uniref:Trypsin-like peptidase domain-containing protein n=1 Tax=Candidatus Nitrospira neomarina TaxID=3020899 RepID=A0AA96JXK7_9BACT|nr:trypsin-like peptidase domain-containing protein [Candidatus Nitrospira neomarina]WNM63345.1 trypsin-like peptidase domain-containing protein [Candidatus Nitrospira neomarina]